MLKVNNKKTKTRCEICSKLIIKTPERRHWHFEQLNAGWEGFDKKVLMKMPYRLILDKARDSDFEGLH